MANDYVRQVLKTHLFELKVHLKLGLLLGKLELLLLIQRSLDLLLLIDIHTTRGEPGLVRGWSAVTKAMEKGTSIRDVSHWVRRGLVGVGDSVVEFGGHDGWKGEDRVE